MTTYAASVQRLIARLVLLVAVLLMPFGMSAAPAEHHAMPSLTDAQHCPDQPSGHHGKVGIADCTMVCSSALPAVDRLTGDALRLTSAPPAPARAQTLHGILLETSTPPPKRS